jgi:hypothetical protein
MRFRTFAAALSLLVSFASTPNLHAFDAPALTGHITRLASPQDFDVNGIQVLVTPTTKAETRHTQTASADPAKWPTLHIGDIVSIYGKLDFRSHTLNAILISVDPPVDSGTIRGTGIIDLIPPASPSAAPDTLLVRADGYLILLTPKTAITWPPTMRASLSGIHTNIWIMYHGGRQPDGTVTADWASFEPNSIAHSEDKLLTKTNYDPTQVDPDARQSATSKFFRGLDLKQIPPYKDRALQARVERIGASLIPSFQRALPDDDPTKIHFRFQIVDRNWKDAISTPSGVIVIPRTIVERLADDSQLATVLADNIAAALEKRDYRDAPKRNSIGVDQAATEVAGIFVPPLLIAGVAGGIGGEAIIKRQAEDQSGRVSLSLLHDAGYDITQAPLTWWILSSKPNRDFADSAMPHRASYLYEFLSSNWTGKASPSQPPPP